eukprot:scaffold12949_cov20-Tisochrysis_lutea.AAC.4
MNSSSGNNKPQGRGHACVSAGAQQRAKRARQFWNIPQRPRSCLRSSRGTTKDGTFYNSQDTANVPAAAPQGLSTSPPAAADVSSVEQ